MVIHLEIEIEGARLLSVHFSAAEGAGSCPRLEIPHVARRFLPIWQRSCMADYFGR